MVSCSLKNSQWKHGYTIFELLVVMAIIVILAALLSPAISNMRNTGKKVRAKSEIVDISAALQAYNAEYGVWPMNHDLTLPSTTSPLTAAQLQALYLILTGTDCPLDYPSSTTQGIGNPKKIVFLQSINAKPVSTIAVNNLYPVSSGSTTTNMVDPWNCSYGVVFGTGSPVQFHVYGSGSGMASGSFGIWSGGPDQNINPNETGPADTLPSNMDNVSNWK